MHVLTILKVNMLGINCEELHLPDLSTFPEEVARLAVIDTIDNIIPHKSVTSKPFIVSPSLTRTIAIIRRDKHDY